MYKQSILTKLLLTINFIGKEEERQMFQQMQAMAQKQVRSQNLFIT